MPGRSPRSLAGPRARFAAQHAALGARWRLRLARSRWLRIGIVVALAGSAGLVAARAVAGVEDAQAQWGELRTVWVAHSDIAPGESLQGAIERRDLPSPMVPPSAVELDANVLVLTVARQSISAGEVVVAVDVAAPAGPQALVPAGWLAVPVAESVGSGARAGDAVHVATGGVVLASEAVVVGREPTGGAVLVAVPAGVAAQVAQASSAGDVVLMLGG